MSPQYFDSRRLTVPLTDLSLQCGWCRAPWLRWLPAVSLRSREIDLDILRKRARRSERQNSSREQHSNVPRRVVNKTVPPCSSSLVFEGSSVAPAGYPCTLPKY